MLPFATLLVELIKINDYLKTRNIAIETHWGVDNHNKDLLTFTCRRDFKIFQWKIYRHNWDECFEFVLVDNNGTHNYRIDPLKHEPIRIDKAISLSNIWTTIDAPSHDAREFAKEIYKILIDLEQKFLRENSEYYHAIVSQR
jgi:hypothetical protein